MNVSRRRYMGEKGGSIPYQRIEYLETTGTQYIKTNYVPEIGDEFHVEFLLNEFGTSNETLYCAGSNTYSTIFLVAYNPTGVNGAYFKHFASGSAKELSFKPSIKTWYSLDVSALGFADVNSYTITSTPQQELTGTDKTLWILKRNNNTQPFFGQFRNFTITNNGIKKLDLIPVRIGTTGYMYDTISGELFGNAGTGDFTLGQDVTALPYQEIEYLENTGNSYIETNYNPLIGDYIHIEYKSTTVATPDNSGVVLWAGTNTYQTGLLIFSVTTMFVDLFTTSPQTFNITSDAVHWFAMNMSSNEASININSASFSEQSELEQNKSMWLFRRRNNTSPHHGGIKSFWAERSGERIIDLVPVRVGSVGYMYDKVSGELFGNAGTGDFVLGPDVNE